MSQYTNLMSIGHAFFVTLAQVTVTCGGVSKTGIPSSMTKWSDEDPTGYISQQDGSVIFFREEVEAMGLAYETRVTIGGQPFRVVRIIGDAADPTQEVFFRHG